MKIVFSILFLFLLPHFSMAQENNISLTPVQMQRAEMLGSEFRCLVCQNESIQDSSSSLAAQLRTIIRKQVSKDASNQQIKNYMVQRYGTFILLNPPFSPITFLLYGSPFLALFFGIWLFYLNVHKTKEHVPPLSKAGTARLDEILK